jgi:hypothetical protein
MLSEAQQSITSSKQAMPENDKYDGPSGIKQSTGQNNFAANANTSLPKPGFDS